MTTLEKKKRAALIAVAYLIEEQLLTKNEHDVKKNNWLRMAKKVSMNNRAMVQSRGKIFNV